MKQNLLKYNFLLGILILLFSSQSFGENSNVKSLLADLKGENDSIIADSLYHIGLSNYKDNQHVPTVDYLKKSIQYYLKIDDQKTIINALNLIGHSYLKQEIYDQALKNYLLALDLSEKINDNGEIAKTLNSLGRHSSHLKNYKKSLTYYKKSLNLIESLENNTKMKAKSLNNIGMIYGLLNEVDKSLEYFNRSLSLRYELGKKEDISILINNIGYAYVLKKDYPKAFEQFNISLEISEEINDNVGTAFALLNIAELHIAQKNYTKAIPELLRGLKLAQELESPKQVDLLTSDSYEFLAEAYEGIGDTKNGLFYFKKFNEIQRKLFHKEFDNELKNTELLNNLEVKKQEVNQLSKENKIKELQLKSNNNFILSLLILLIIISLFFIIFYFQKRNLKEANKALVIKNLEIVKNETKLKNIIQKTSTIEKTTEKPNNSPEAKYSNSPLEGQKKDLILNNILIQFEQEKLYLKDDLTLIMLSNIINTNKSYISQIINEKFEKNFSSFINEYRIKEARKLLSQKENWGLTIESTANAVGFKSISAFNTAFKKYTGITPSYFMNTVKSDSKD